MVDITNYLLHEDRIKKDKVFHVALTFEELTILRSMAKRHRRVSPLVLDIYDVSREMIDHSGE